MHRHKIYAVTETQFEYFEIIIESFFKDLHNVLRWCRIAYNENGSDVMLLIHHQFSGYRGA